MNQVTDRLWIGSMIHSVQDVTEIRSMGISHVIDCCEDDEVALFPATTDIALLSCPTADDGQFKSERWFAPGIDFGVGALAHPGFRLLTHCAAGVNRGPSMAYAVMRAVGWRSDDALETIHKYRGQTNGGVRYWHDADQALIALGWLK